MIHFAKLNTTKSNHAKRVYNIYKQEAPNAKIIKVDEIVANSNKQAIFSFREKQALALAEKYVLEARAAAFVKR